MKTDMIQEFFNEHYNQFSSETVRAYELSLKQFFSTTQKSYDEVKARDVRNWLEAMSDQGLKTRSIQLKLAAVKSFYQFCMEENKLDKNPVKRVKKPLNEDSLPRYITKRQLALLQELTIDDPRDRVIVEMLYATGVRISELLNIRLADIKWNTRQIWIKGKGRKERFVLFSHECEERMKSYLEIRKYDGEYLFSNAKGQPISRDLVQLNFRKYTEELGFTVTPHMLRHTLAANLVEKGMDPAYIQDLLGHSNINSTRIYTKLKTPERKKQYDQYQK